MIVIEAKGGYYVVERADSMYDRVQLLKGKKVLIAPRIASHYNLVGDTTFSRVKETLIIHSLYMHNQ